MSLAPSFEELIHVIDLTQLNIDDSADDIIQLCLQAQTPMGNVAAVCIMPTLVSIAAQALKNTDIKIATVANFPQGDASLNDTLDTISMAIDSGADEIDLVMPYQQFLLGNIDFVKDYLATCKNLCKSVVFKIILETGALKNNVNIFNASQIAIACGADFIKTSTGKIAAGASLEAVNCMLTAIQSSSKPVGLKISGGVSTMDIANEYCQLVVSQMGINYFKPEFFRIGASRLLDDILARKNKK